MTIQDQIHHAQEELAKASDERTKSHIRRVIRQLGFRLIDEIKGSKHV
ncbi:hypothetical protein PAAL109150_09880 [Paenibacillus alkaliterrae]